MKIIQSTRCVKDIKNNYKTQKNKKIKKKPQGQIKGEMVLINIDEWSKTTTLKES